MEDGRNTSEKLEKKLQLFRNQKETLDIFLAHHTITKEQYEKSLKGLITKMGISDELSSNMNDME